MLNTIAAFLLLTGLGLSYWQYNTISGKEIAVGRVTALEPHSGSKGSRTYSLVASFRDAAGQEHTYHASFSSSSTGFEVGDSIRIWFERDNPGHCGVLSFGYRFGVAWILIVLGLSLGFAQWGWQAGNRWLDGHFQTTVPMQPFTGHDISSGPP